MYICEGGSAGQEQMPLRSADILKHAHETLYTCCMAWATCVERAVGANVARRQRFSVESDGVCSSVDSGRTPELSLASTHVAGTFAICFCNIGLTNFGWLPHPCPANYAACRNGRAWATWVGSFVQRLVSPSVLSNRFSARCLGCRRRHPQPQLRRRNLRRRTRTMHRHEST